MNQNSWLSTEMIWMYFSAALTLLVEGLTALSWCNGITTYLYMGRKKVCATMLVIPDGNLRNCTLEHNECLYSTIRSMLNIQQIVTREPGIINVMYIMFSILCILEHDWYLDLGYSQISTPRLVPDHMFSRSVAQSTTPKNIVKSAPNLQEEHKIIWEWQYRSYLPTELN